MVCLYSIAVLKFTEPKDAVPCIMIKMNCVILVDCSHQCIEAHWTRLIGGIYYKRTYIFNTHHTGGIL